MKGSIDVVDESTGIAKVVMDNKEIKYFVNKKNWKEGDRIELVDNQWEKIIDSRKEDMFSLQEKILKKRDVANEK